MRRILISFRSLRSPCKDNFGSKGKTSFPSILLGAQCRSGLRFLVKLGIQIGETFAADTTSWLSSVNFLDDPKLLCRLHAHAEHI